MMMRRLGLAELAFHIVVVQMQRVVIERGIAESRMDSRLTANGAPVMVSRG